MTPLNNDCASGTDALAVIDEPAEFALLASAEQALSAASSIDEVKSIRDKAVAARAYARKAGLGTKSLNYCLAIILRAERLAGEMLIAMGGGEHGGDRKSKHKECIDFDAVAPRHDRLRFYNLCSIPDAEFKPLLEEVATSGKKLAMPKVLKLAKKSEKTVEAQSATESAVSHGIVASLHDLIAAGAKFSTIYADPPWRYDNKATRSNVDSAATYSGTMTVDEICAEPVAELANDEAHLHLWTTNAFLFDARRVMEAWGFEYKSCFVWVKPQMGIGNYWRVSHEFMLLGVRGGLRFANRGQKSWLEHDRARHSQKPHIVRNIIEKVSPGPCLEMYGRHIVDGWTVYGNQIIGHAQREFSIQPDLF